MRSFISKRSTVTTATRPPSSGRVHRGPTIFPSPTDVWLPNLIWVRPLSHVRCQSIQHFSGRRRHCRARCRPEAGAHHRLKLADCPTLHVVVRNGLCRDIVNQWRSAAHGGAYHSSLGRFLCLAEPGGTGIRPAQALWQSRACGRCLSTERSRHAKPETAFLTGIRSHFIVACAMRPTSLCLRCGRRQP